MPWHAIERSEFVRVAERCGVKRSVAEAIKRGPIQEDEIQIAWSYDCMIGGIHSFDCPAS